MEEFPKKRDLTGQEIQDAQEGLLSWHIEEQDKRIREQEEQIEHDFLTKLKTRHVLENELEKSLQFIRGEIPEQRGEALSELSLIAMDIDHFKDINDGLGHAAGDAVLTVLCAPAISWRAGAEKSLWCLCRAPTSARQRGKLRSFAQK